MIQRAINWQQDWSTLHGFVIKSPFTGQVLPAALHPEAIYKQDILATSVCCRLQQGTIVSPFNAELLTARAGQRRIQLTHPSGLVLLMDLPYVLAQFYGIGVHWLARPGQNITAGGPLLQLDLPYLQRALPDIYCLATLTTVDHSATRLPKIYCRQARVTAMQDPLFVLQHAE